MKNIPLLPVKSVIILTNLIGIILFIATSDIILIKHYQSY